MVFSHNCDGESFTCEHLLEDFCVAYKSPKPPRFCEFARVKFKPGGGGGGGAHKQDFMMYYISNVF